ncbi:hypothetical protein K493DRAFT_342194 [Basidiobolus meristosporus CBS 931.73]|uniref:Uncharacterized protein n=1 Tax=Basidiobolus meristosporus CBS 931.73 TaxID=1314790 RepID=A0A1Y1X9F3_9FUNG|nr:hypothetical protein K493DRAFT_342194 [Basidiobolus meristosporus CBS 931.73]|eukprot:ORX82401.1 hypothetical protein K493DRAFT_342194 [Basidiobolus meristosporus CBS 931.73]
MSTIGRSWETAETKLLINLRQDMNREFDSMKRNAPLWKKISEYMNSTGYHRTDKQCKEKWKNLLSEFKRNETLKECERKAFPYYDMLKDIVSKQGSFTDSPAQPEDAVHTSYPPSPTPISNAVVEYGPIMDSHHSRVTLPIPVGYSPSASFNRISKQFDAHMHTPVYKPPLQEFANEAATTQSSKRKRDFATPDKSHATLLSEIIELLRFEINERRRWEERLHLNQIQHERRKERQEKRRERRERERQERQRAQTLLLVAIASKIMPNVTEIIRSFNFHEGSGSDSEKTGNASNSN